MVTTNAVDLYPVWSSVTTYAKDERVTYQYRTYLSLQATNTNQNPVTASTFWQDIGPSNTTAAFDTSYSTQTTRTSPLTFSIVPSSINTSLALMNLDGITSIVVEIISTLEGVVYTRTIDTTGGSIITDWFDYFFTPFSLIRDVVLTDLPPYSDVTINLTFNSDTTVKVGTIILGTVYEIGDTQYGLNYGIRDWSIKREDDFGNIVFLERNYSKRLEPNVYVNNIDFRKVTNLLTNIRAEPTVFIPTEDEGYDSLITLGYLSDWNIEITYPTASMLRLDIKGLT